MGHAHRHTKAANRSDIVLKNEDKTCLLIDMTVPLDANTSVKTTEKLNKYKDLEFEVQCVERMWGLKTTTVLVVMGALSTIKNGMESYINKIPGNINIQYMNSRK